MRKAMPRMTENADEGQRRMKSDPAIQKRQRRHAFYRAASGHALAACTWGALQHQCVIAHLLCGACYDDGKGYIYLMVAI
jgi:hypothetical protein